MTDSPTHAAGPADVADRYRRLAERFTTVIDAVPADRWSAPSPCDGWTARDVVSHVVTTERDFLATMPFGTVDDLVDADGDPVTAWPLVRDRIQAALDDPLTAGHEYDGYFGPTTFAATVDQFYGADLVVHAWDLARAAGLRELEAIDADDLAWVSATLGALGDNVRMPGVLGPEVHLADPAAASDQDRFLAWAGRDPS